MGLRLDMGNVPSGSCEEINLPDFSGDPKCLRISQSSPTGLLKEKFLNADFAEIAILHFFTASCPRVPVRGARGQLSPRLGVRYVTVLQGLKKFSVGALEVDADCGDLHLAKKNVLPI